MVDPVKPIPEKRSFSLWQLKTDSALQGKEGLDKAFEVSRKNDFVADVWDGKDIRVSLRDVNLFAADARVDRTLAPKMMGVVQDRLKDEEEFSHDHNVDAIATEADSPKRVADSTRLTEAMVKDAETFRKTFLRFSYEQRIALATVAGHADPETAKKFVGLVLAELSKDHPGLSKSDLDSRNDEYAELLWVIPPDKLKYALYDDHAFGGIPSPEWYLSYDAQGALLGRGFDLTRQLESAPPRLGMKRLKSISDHLSQAKSEGDLSFLPGAGLPPFQLTLLTPFVWKTN